MRRSQNIVLGRDNKTLYYLYITDEQLESLSKRGHIEVTKFNGYEYYKPTEHSWTYLRKELL